MNRTELLIKAINYDYPVKTREDIRTLKIPDDRTGRMYHGFMYLRIPELGPDVSLEVIEAALAALEKYRHYGK